MKTFKEFLKGELVTEFVNQFANIKDVRRFDHVKRDMSKEQAEEAAKEILNKNKKVIQDALKKFRVYFEEIR